MVMLAECDVAGIWELDLDLLLLYTKTPITLDEILHYLNQDKERIKYLAGDRVWLTGFVAFQYGPLSPASPPHRKVISRLTELNLPFTLKPTPEEKAKYPIKPSSPTPQEEEEEEEEDKEKKEEEEKERAARQKLVDECNKKFNTSTTMYQAGENL
jgi:hypothetical protein